MEIIPEKKITEYLEKLWEPARKCPTNQIASFSQSDYPTNQKIFLPIVLQEALLDRRSIAAGNGLQIVTTCENAKFTYCDIPEQGKKISMDRINKLNSKKIIQKNLGESIEWRRY